MGSPRDPGLPPSGPRPSADVGSEVPADTDVHAFLIADMRGWTSFTQEHGDEEAGRLAARFAEVARDVIGEHQGKVLELRGDEALCVFGSPRSAIRAAVALQQRFVEETIADPELPLTVGIGLDAGEAVPVDGGYRGGALNVAARLCSRARAGEVLASREIVHLARRVDGLRFTERGQSELKGLDQPVHVVQVRSEERDTAEAIAPYVRTTAPRSRHRRRNVLAGVLAFAVLAALIAVPLARRSGGSSEIAPNSIGILDPESGEVTATLGLEARPGSIAASEDAVWVAHPDTDTVTRIDSEEQAVIDRIPVGESPTAIAVGEGSVWVVESGGPSVSRISPGTGEIVETIKVGNGPAHVAVGEGAVWVSNRFDGTVSRLDPVSGEVVEIAVGLDPSGIATGFGSVWVGLSGSNEVVRINPATNKVAATIDVGNAPDSLAVSASAVWVANSLADTISRLDPDTNLEAEAISVGDGPSGVAVIDGIVWVANEVDGSLSRVASGETPEQRSVRTVSIGSVPQGLTDAAEDLWVSVRGTATEHVGGTLRVVSASSPKDLSLDPTTAIDPHQAPWLHLLGDGLVAFEPIGGTAATLVPDLAASYPAVSPDGRTYTFELREGILYSNGDEVAPSDFRFALERGFRLLTDPHADIYGGLVGAMACTEEPATCDLSDGIKTDDAANTITFHLTAPDPEFLYKLALPYAYAVPPSVPIDEGRSSVPGTGPYMVEAPANGHAVALVRNPHFRVWSPAQPDGYVDRIEWLGAVDAGARIEAVIAGDADLAIDLGDDGSAQQLDELLVRFAAQIYTPPTTEPLFVKIDAEMPPFDDVRVRRAVNYALDRDRILQIWGGVAAAAPTCQLLPPNFPGYERYCRFTTDPHSDGYWNSPDLEKSRRLIQVSGTRGMPVVFEYPAFPRAGPVTDYMVELLRELGYDATARVFRANAKYFGPREFQLAFTGWGANFPSASDYIRPLIACDAPHGPAAGSQGSAGSWQPFCDHRIDAMIDRATKVQADDPTEASARWAAVDRAIADQAPYVWLVNLNSVGFVAENVGNYQFNQQYDILLNQLWVQ